MWVSGIELRSSDLAASTFTHWAILPAHEGLFLVSPLLPTSLPIPCSIIYILVPFQQSLNLSGEYCSLEGRKVHLQLNALSLALNLWKEPHRENRGAPCGEDKPRFRLGSGDADLQSQLPWRMRQENCAFNDSQGCRVSSWPLYREGVMWEVPIDQVIQSFLCCPCLFPYCIILIICTPNYVEV